MGGELPRASAADAARTLAATNTAGTLSTLSVDPAGYPFGSVVSFTVDAEGDPLFVISRLAVHTTNVLADQRASLLVAEAVDAGIDPLARSRVTLLGDVAPVPSAEQETAVEAVASRVPGVAGYVSYGDFACYRLCVRVVRWVGGFGEMDWVSSDGYRAATVDPVLPARHRIMAHMDDDHADAGLMLCSKALGAPVTSASMHHVDRFGCEYTARLDDGVAIVRLAFSTPATGLDDVRRRMVDLVREARKR